MSRSSRLWIAATAFSLAASGAMSLMLNPALNNQLGWSIVAVLFAIAATFGLLALRATPQKPRPDMSLEDALAWILGSRKFFTISDGGVGLNAVFGGLAQLREKAANDLIHSWARGDLTFASNSEHAPRKPIDSGLWREFHIDGLEFLGDHKGKFESAGVDARSDFWFCRAEIRREFPRPFWKKLPRVMGIA